MYAKNSASANRIIKADKYGEYTVYIPASENSGVLTAIANTVAADVAVYKEGSATPIKTGDKGMLDKAELTGMNAEENKFKIVVTAGEQSVAYKFNVVKANGDAGIKSITAQPGTPEAYTADSPDAGSGDIYTVYIDEKVNAADIRIVANDRHALINVRGEMNRGSLAMNTGNLTSRITEIPFTVTASDESVKTYTLRVAKINTVAGLEKVEFNDKSIAPTGDSYIIDLDRATYPDLDDVKGRLILLALGGKVKLIDSEGSALDKDGTAPVPAGRNRASLWDKKEFEIGRAHV